MLWADRLSRFSRVCSVLYVEDRSYVGINNVVDTGCSALLSSAFSTPCEAVTHGANIC